MLGIRRSKKSMTSITVGDIAVGGITIYMMWQISISIDINFIMIITPFLIKLLLH